MKRMPRRAPPGEHPRGHRVLDRCHPDRTLGQASGSGNARASTCSSGRIELEQVEATARHEEQRALPLGLAPYGGAVPARPEEVVPVIVPAPAECRGGAERHARVGGHRTGERRHDVTVTEEAEPEPLHPCVHAVARAFRIHAANGQSWTARDGRSRTGGVLSRPAVGRHQRQRQRACGICAADQHVRTPPPRGLDDDRHSGAHRTAEEAGRILERGAFDKRGLRPGDEAQRPPVRGRRLSRDPWVDARPDQCGRASCEKGPALHRMNEDYDALP